MDPSGKTIKAQGHCLCGKIKYQLDGPLHYNVLCHCENCRHATGSAFLCASIVPKPTFKLLKGEEHLKTYSDPDTESTQALTRQFCSNCGSNLFALTPLNESIISVFAGNYVEKMGDWVPMREQFCAQRVVGEWLQMPENVIRTQTNPGSKELGRFGKEES